MLYFIINRYDSYAIEKIVHWVYALLKRTCFGDDNLVGIDSHLKELKSLIGIGFYDVRTLGVWGLGGIGKTTIVKVIYDLISCQFDCVSFLANVCKQSMPKVKKKLLTLQNCPMKA